MPVTVSWNPAPATTAGRSSAIISMESPSAPRLRAGVILNRPSTNAEVIHAARTAEVGAPISSTYAHTPIATPAARVRGGRPASATIPPSSAAITPT